MPLTPEQEELKTFAQRAAEGGRWYTVDDILPAEKAEWCFLVQDANFIAAANPAAILALLAQIEAQEAPVATLTEPDTCPMCNGSIDAHAFNCLANPETLDHDAP